MKFKKILAILLLVIITVPCTVLRLLLENPPKIREMGLYEDLCDTFPKSEKIIIYKSGNYFSIEIYLKDKYKEVEIQFYSIGEFKRYKSENLRGE